MKQTNENYFQKNYLNGSAYKLKNKIFLMLPKQTVLIASRPMALVFVKQSFFTKSESFRIESRFCKKTLAIAVT